MTPRPIITERFTSATLAEAKAAAVAALEALGDGVAWWSLSTDRPADGSYTVSVEYRLEAGE